MPPKWLPERLLEGPGRQGLSLGRLSAVRRDRRAVRGLSWGASERSWEGLWGALRVLGRPAGDLGASWGGLGAVWARLRPSWVVLGRVLGPFQGHLGTALGSAPCAPHFWLEKIEAPKPTKR